MAFERRRDSSLPPTNPLDDSGRFSRKVIRIPKGHGCHRRVGRLPGDLVSSRETRRIEPPSCVDFSIIAFYPGYEDDLLSNAKPYLLSGEAY